MKVFSRFLSVAVVAAVALVPARANAQGCAYTYSLGLGGTLNGCFTGTITELGEDAGYISNQYYWAGNFTGSSGAINAPNTSGTLMFDDDCGSAGNGTFAFCTGAYTKPAVSITNSAGELVLGLDVTDMSYGNPSFWDYSGTLLRNATPPPAGFQAVLLQLTKNGADDPGQFMFGWEDLNTGCTARPAVNNNRYREEDLGNAALLNSVLDDCSAITPGGNSDSDFNDSYLLFNISGNGTLASVVPEPMTMSLMAIGLVSMGAASRRRRMRK